MGKYEIKRSGSVGTESGMEDKKNKYCPDIIDCIDKYQSVFLKALPVWGLVATILAMISLFHYAHEEKIDVFSHYSSWVSFLPIITVAETLIVVVITLYCFVIVFIIDEFSPKHKGYKLCDRDETGQCLLLVFFQYSFLVVVPVLSVYHSGINDFLERYPISIILYCLYFAFFNALIVNSLFLNKEKITKKYWANNWASNIWGDHLSVKVFNKTFFYSFLLAVFVPSISIALSWFFIGDIGLSQSVDIWGLFVGIGILLMNIVSSGILYTNSWGDHRVKPVFVMFFSISFVYISVTPLSAKISAAALNKLNMGGGIERVYYLIEGNKGKIPGQFIDGECCKNNICLTKILSLRWAVGDFVYASLAEEKAEQGQNEKDKEKSNPTNEQAIAKQSIALPGDILFPYRLHEGMPGDCETQKNLIKAAQKERAKKEGTEKEGNK